jgi:hypothetical protein
VPRDIPIRPDDLADRYGNRALIDDLSRRPPSSRERPPDEREDAAFPMPRQ